MLIFLCISFLAIERAHAQEPTQVKPIWNSNGLKVELGTNASFFIGNFLNITGLGDPVFNDPFGIHVRVIQNEFALSGAINGTLTNSKQTESDNDIVRISNGHNFNYRLALEYQHMVAKRWKLNLGINYLGESVKFQNRTETGSQWSESLSSSISHGVGPSIEFQYYINEKISLFTRSVVAYNFGRTFSESQQSIDPSSARKINSDFQNIRFSFPSSIFIAIQL